MLNSSADTLGQNRPAIRRVLAIFAVTVLAKGAAALIAAQEPARFFARDSRSYIEPARVLYETGRFATSFDPSAPVDTLRTPGYPVFLAAVQAAAGSGSLPIVATQILIGLGTAWIVFLVARARAGEACGVLAVSLVCLDAASFGTGLLVLTETLFTALAVVAWWLAIRIEERDLAWTDLALFGLVLGCGVLVRPITYYLGLPAAAWVLLLGCQRRLSPRRLVASAVLVLAVWSVPVGGWKLRNWSQTGVPLLSRIEGINMLFYRAAAVLALRDGISLEDARTNLGRDSYRELHPDAARLSEEELAARWSAEGRAVLLSHPGLFLRTQIAGLGPILFGLGHHTVAKLLGVRVPSEGPVGDLARLGPRKYAEKWLRDHPGLFAAFVLEEMYLMMLYAGTGAWIWTALRRRDFSGSDMWACFFFVYLLWISAGPEAYARFRVPLIPTLSVFAAIGLGRLRSKVARLRPLLVRG